MTYHSSDQPFQKTGIVRSLVFNRRLIYQLTRRSITGRYRGSVAGMAWSLFIPLMMLAVYTLVFGYIFNLRFNQSGDGGNLDFAIFLFAGIVVHGFMAECLNRSPSLVTGNAQYVKKIVFPIECLTWIAVFTALFQTSISILILCIFVFLVNGSLHPTLLLLPVVIAPLLIMATGFIWLISAMSVFIRDFAQLMGVLSTLMLFLSPVFYPLSAVPEPLRYVLYLNPISFIIEQVRLTIIEGAMPDWLGLLLYTLVALLITRLGFGLFQRMRKGFADVL